MAYSKELEYYIQLLQGHRQNKGNIKIAIRCSGKNNFFSVYRPVDLSIEQTYTGRMCLSFKEADGAMKDVFFDDVVNIMHDYWVGITEDNTYDMVFHMEDHPPQPKESFKNLTEKDKAYLKEKGITMKPEFEDRIEKDESKDQAMKQPQYHGDARKFVRQLSIKQLTEIFEELMSRAADLEPEEETDLQHLINEVDSQMDNVGDGLEPKMILQCKDLPMQTFQIKNIECINTKHEQGATSLWLTTPDGGLHQWNLFNIRQTKASNFKAQTDDAEIHITFLSS